MSWLPKREHKTRQNIVHRAWYLNLEKCFHYHNKDNFFKERTLKKGGRKGME